VTTAKRKTKAPAGSPKGPASDVHSPEFVRGLIARGEAVVPNPDGSLPPGATHEIVGKAKDGTLLVRRKRFSAF